MLLGLLLLCVLLALVGSGTLQAISFVVGLVVLLVIAGDALPRMRFGGGAPLGGMPRLRRPRSPGGGAGNKSGRRATPRTDPRRRRH